MLVFHYDRDAAALNIEWGSHFALLSLKDEELNPLLKYRHVIKAMRAIATKMVELNQYEEQDIEIWQDGKQIGWGKLGEGVIESMDDTAE